MLLKKSKRSLITMTDEVKSQNEQTGDSGEQTAQTNEQTVQSNSNDTNWKSLHENEVDYNKKLRGKNQELQTKLEQFEKTQAESRQKKMEEAGEFKTIIAEKDQTIESLTKKAGEYDNYLNTRKSELLESFSEDDREQFSHLPLTDIEKLSKRLNVSKSNVPNVPEGRDAKLGEFGGYGSYQEWATKDPKGYEKANKNITNGDIKIGYL